jgi:hypothetical protein
MEVSPACGCGTGTGTGTGLLPSSSLSPCPSLLPFRPFSFGVSRLDPDDDELAILALLPTATVEAAEVGSVNDLALSRLDFCRNLGNLDVGPVPPDDVDDEPCWVGF